jgi:hypothetical protein
MFKKIAITAAGAALLLAVVAPAYAKEPKEEDKGGITITNYGFVANNVATIANTGANMISSDKKGPGGFTLGGGGDHRDENSGSIKTGAAYAYADVTGQANYTDIVCGTCFSSGKLAITNYGMVDNDVLTLANSGFNKASGGKIETGGATAYSYVTGVVNTTLVGFSPAP